MGLKLHENILTRRLFHFANPELLFFKGVKRATETATENAVYLTEATENAVYLTEATENSINQVDSVIVE